MTEKVNEKVRIARDDGERGELTSDWYECPNCHERRIFAWFTHRANYCPMCGREIE